MRVIERAAELAETLDASRARGATVGFVPTMGALHQGHLSLLGAARQECDVVAMSVFVNPLQFGPGEDLERYPRDPAGDRRQAEDAGVDVAFLPSGDQVYPRAPLTSVRVSELSEPLEGAARPTHFEGVATVVAVLFNLVGRCRAYFGEKDYQQLLVVRRLVADLRFPVEVSSRPTVREPDGLAVSSRNTRLGPAERAAAPVLHRALLAGRRQVAAGEVDRDRVEAAMAEVLDTEPLVRPDYVVAVRSSDLASVPRLAGEVRLLVAARLGDVRLIDNLGAEVP